MKWVTRSHVHVDRVACPWLIRRFVDNQAEFLFVPAGMVLQVAKETGAIPFDVAGAELGHHEKRCSFESIILKYGLKNAATGKDHSCRRHRGRTRQRPPCGWPRSHCCGFQPALPG
jgi:hypothetical protein